MAILKRLYNPMQGVVSFKTIDSQLIQEYDADNRTYSPDRRIVPTVVQPIVQVNDPAGKVVNGIKNAELAPEYIKYYENEPKPENEILDSNSGYRIDRTSTNANRGRITIRKNVDAESPITIVFEAVFADKVGAVVRRRLPLQGSFVLTTNVSAQSPLVLKEDYPRGKIFNPLKDFANMKLSADLFAGQKNIPSAFWWYKKTGATETLLTEAYEGHNLREVKIPSVEIGKQQNYLVKVQDCRSELAQIQNGYFEDYYDSKLGRNYIRGSGFIMIKNIYGEVIQLSEPIKGKIVISATRRTVLGKSSYSFVHTLKSDGSRGPNLSLSEGYAEGFTTLPDYITAIRVFPGIDSAGSAGVEVELNDLKFEKEETYDASLRYNYIRGIGSKMIKDIYGEVIPLSEPIKGKIVISATRRTVLGKSSYSFIHTLKKDGSRGPNLTLTEGLSESYATLPDYITSIRVFPGIDSAGSVGVEVELNDLKFEKEETTWQRAPEDIRADANKLMLPPGYRPTPNPLKQKIAELTLSTQYPPYSHRVVTDYGDDANIITIPSDVDTFRAWVEFHTPAGVIENPEKYFDVNWGGGKTGISQTFNADDIGIDLYTLEPTITEKF